jgi:hypothetical protein
MMDCGMVLPPGCHSACAYTLTRRLLPELAEHKLSFVFRHITGQSLDNAHSALADVHGMRAVMDSHLQRFYNSASLEQVRATSGLLMRALPPHHTRGRGGRGSKLYR